MIDDRLVDQPREAWRTVDLSLPLRRAGGSEEDKVLEAQERLRFAVSFLLLAEGLQREPAVVPDDGGGTEGDDLTLLLEAPAEVDIIPGFAVLGVEAADLVKGPLVEGHVASGNVLGHHVREQDMAGTSGGRGDAGLMPVLCWRRDVRSADARVVAREERPDQVIEPVRVGHAVAVGVGNDLAGGVGGADITRDAESHVRLMDCPHPRVMGDDLARVVLGPVVDKNDFVVGIVQLLERAEAGLEGLTAVVTADDDRDLGDGGKRGCRGDGSRPVEEFPDRGEGFLGSAVATDEPEVPVEDLVASAEPLVGPGVKDRPGESATHHGIEMPADHLGLLLLGVADGVHAELPHDEGLVLGEVLESGQVALEVLPAVQVDVESQEVDVLREEVLGRRVAGVGVERAGILPAGDIDQMLDELGDALGSEPAHHGGGDLVAEQVSEDRVVPLVLPDGRDDRLLDGGPDLGIVQELDMLHPGDAQEDADAVLQTEIQEPGGGIGVDANEVRSTLTDRGKVSGGLLPGPEFIPLGIGREGTVGHSLEEKLLLSLEEELRAHGHAFSHRNTISG